jgi:hypothetical protein
MKKRPEPTKEQRERDIRFIRKGSPKLRKHKKLINGRTTKEDLVMLLSSLWANFGKLTIKKVKEDFFSGKEVNVRKFKNIPAFGRFNKYSRKVLAGMYGSTLQIARKEGLFN